MFFASELGRNPLQYCVGKGGAFLDLLFLG